MFTTQTAKARSVPVRKSLHGAARALALAATLAGLHGCASVGTPAFDPVSTDQPIDAAFPATTRFLVVPSHGSQMYGRLLGAQGAGAHPTVVLLHGLPGAELNLDLAQTLRRAGWNVLAVHYRGSWGSTGEFSVKNVLEDVHSMLAWVRAQSATPANRMDARNIVIIGHSVGGFAALRAAAADPEVKAVAAISPADLGLTGQRYATDAQFRERGVNLFKSGSVLRVPDADMLVRDWAAAAPTLKMPGLAQALAKKSIFLSGARKDVITPLQEHFGPLKEAFQLAGAGNVTEIVLDTDHSYSDQRVTLNRAVLGWLQRQR